MEIVLLVLESKTLGDLEYEDTVDHETYPMYNDYDANPIHTFYPVDKKVVHGKKEDCTKFHLSNGLAFITPCNHLKFVEVKGNINKLQEENHHFRQSKEMWVSQALGGKAIYILN